MSATPLAILYIVHIWIIDNGKPKTCNFDAALASAKDKSIGDSAHLFSSVCRELSNVVILPNILSLTSAHVDVINYRQCNPILRT